MPRRATLCAGTPESDDPLNDQSPESGWSKPVSRLKNVVLPAPFGPISAVMAPRLQLDVVDVDRGEAAELSLDVVGDQDRVGLGRARLVWHVLERLPGGVAPVAAAAGLGAGHHPGRRRRLGRVGGLVSGHRARSPSGHRRSPVVGRSSEP
jgi:hypothetical protein